MLGGYLHYGLLVALAIALLVAAATDWRRRQIDNWLNLAIVIGAPFYWWASGLTLWPGVAIKARRILRPSSVRTGMFCRFGSFDESRPVVVAASA